MFSNKLSGDASSVAVYFSYYVAYALKKGGFRCGLNTLAFVVFRFSSTRGIRI